MDPARICVSLSGADLDRVRAEASRLPSDTLVELRADALPPAEHERGRWRDLPREVERSWVFTWRSPGEGGAAPRPRGLLARALEAGFTYIDVEAAALDAGDPEALAVPPDRRWVSAHPAAPPANREAAVATWRWVRSHGAAMHKLVLLADRFEVNTWCLELAGEPAGDSAAATVFAQGWLGQPSRLLGHLQGNAVTYAAPQAGSATAPGQPTWDSLQDLYGMSRFNTSPEVYGVLGDPVRASLSPPLHNGAYRARSLNALYIPLESPDPAPVIEWIREGRLRGVSVTAPHKNAVFAMAQELEPVAARIGSINTLWMQDERLWGANTDYEAAHTLLPGLGSNGGPVAVLGAGGAAAAVVAAATDLGARVTVFNRDPDHAASLAARFDVTPGGSIERFRPEDFSVMVNTTPLGHGAPLPDSWSGAAWRGTGVLDLAYGSAGAGCGQLAAAAGAPTVDGISFLAHQAVGQIRRWFGETVPAHVLEDALR